MASILVGFLMAGIAVTASPAVSQEDADDVAPSISKDVPIRPRPALPPQANKLRITVTELPVAMVDERYIAVLTALGGRLPYTWTAEGLPDGLRVSGHQILGRPDESGTFVVTLTVTDATGVRGRTVSADVPLTVEPAVFPDAEVISVSAGGGQTCAVLEGGALYCWGLNAHGQLGLGDQEDRLVPTLVAYANVEGSIVPLPP
ncbi:MAG: putative Ig domain-containing protein, partial [Actinomycetes bacterium]|nr:putative Ig domain-containing protein [Actinomycetes bacterium]MDX5380455.1 putative Ig domain-containing protein [Actinomycetes bacterium]MDX5399288.1 putative Ig domain-containing protein [Actinomycetes bacterium]MDX5450188.1 putative Ig domain-containing protein [Actinomycetes bacterium]